jgi:hypothetical protein
LRRRLAHVLAFVAGTFLPTATNLGKPLVLPATKPDSRLQQLKAFFRELNSPAEHLAPDFLKASDRYRHDWRLLPSIAVVETGGGKVAPNNNLMGWSSGTVRFRTPAEGIHTVAERLANSGYYRYKSLDEMLETYNPVGGYPQRVREVMQMIGEPERGPKLPPRPRLASGY